MVENLDKLLQRDGKIEIIASKAEQLSTSSSTYRKNARKAKLKMRNRRIFLGLMGFIIIAVRAVLMIICSVGGRLLVGGHYMRRIYVQRLQSMKEF